MTYAEICLIVGCFTSSGICFSNALNRVDMTERSTTIALLPTAIGVILYIGGTLF